MEKSGTSRQATDDKITQHMRFAWLINKAAYTNTKNIAFPRQKWLRERALMSSVVFMVLLGRYRNLTRPHHFRISSNVSLTTDPVIRLYVAFSY